MQIYIFELYNYNINEIYHINVTTLSSDGLEQEANSPRNIALKKIISLQGSKRC